MSFASRWGDSACDLEGQSHALYGPGLVEFGVERGRFLQFAFVSLRTVLRTVLYSIYLIVHSAKEVNDLTSPTCRLTITILLRYGVTCRMQISVSSAYATPNRSSIASIASIASRLLRTLSPDITSHTWPRRGTVKTVHLRLAVNQPTSNHWTYQTIGSCCWC